MPLLYVLFFFSSRRRHTRLQGDWSSDVCSSDLRKGTSKSKHLRRFIFSTLNANGSTQPASCVVILLRRLDSGKHLQGPACAHEPRPLKQPNQRLEYQHSHGTPRARYRGDGAEE